MLRRKQGYKDLSKGIAKRKRALKRQTSNHTLFRTEARKIARPVQDGEARKHTLTSGMSPYEQNWGYPPPLPRALLQKHSCILSLLTHLHGKIPNWILYLRYTTGCHGIQQIPCLDRNIVVTGRAVIMPQGNNKNVQYVVHIHNPDRLGTVTEVNSNINIASVPDFDANVCRVSRFYRRNVLDKSKTIDWRNHRDLKVENGLGEKVFCY